MVFSGDDKDWSDGESRFVALAHLKGFSGVMEGKSMPPNETDATATDADQLKLRKYNLRG